MKMILILTFLSIGFGAIANEENFESAKTMMIGNLDKRINVLQTAKSCIQSSTTREQMKECHKTLRASMETIKEESEASRKSFKEEMKKKKEEKKSKK